MSFALIKWIVGLIFIAGVTYAGYKQLAKDVNGIGARGRNAEWERYKGQLVQVAEEDDKKARRWMVEQFLKR